MMYTMTKLCPICKQQTHEAKNLRIACHALAVIILGRDKTESGSQTGINRARSF